MTFEDDKLNREKYADFLTEIIKNNDIYKRISDSESMSIAIDSGWGTGKTTFLEMWEDKLKKIKNENDQEYFEVIRYNAWKNDFLSNPIESIIYTIVNSKLFEYERRNIEVERNLVNNTKKILKLTTKLVTWLASDKHFGDGVGEASGDYIENMLNISQKSSNDNNIFDEHLYKNYNVIFNTIENIKELLESITIDTPIIFIIDELDRCRPLFAIKVLECIKHIFDVHNITFVFALDMQQLGCSVKCIYGSQIDANGYLCRFFDYISKLPKADIELYMEYLGKDRSLIRNEFDYEDDEGIERIWVLDLFSKMAKEQNLSLRDINTIYSNFLILEKLELRSTNNIYAYIFYFLLLILKYKNGEEFVSFLNNSWSVNSLGLSDIYDNERIFNIMFSQIGELTFSNKIKDIEYQFVTDSYINNKVYISKIDDKNIHVKKDLRSNAHKDSYQLEEGSCFSCILFYDDLIKWNQIKDMTLGQYIQEKLEFFNFEGIDN